MKISVDTHTHTNASTHAYSTLEENARYAASIGLEAIAMTNHGPAMPDSPHITHFENVSVIPRSLCNVKILYGAEANITDTDGTLDIEPSVLSRLDVVIASMHTETFEPINRKAHTQAYIKALENPYVDIIGHSGSPDYEYNIDAVIAVAKREGKMIEINNNSHLVRKGSHEICRSIAKKCMDMGVMVTIGSDAHVSAEIGNFKEALLMLSEIDFPEELITNTSLEKFLAVLRQRKLVGGL